MNIMGIPSFSPENFRYIENADPLKQKQLAKGIDQLMDEGVAQLFVHQMTNRKIIGTVGPLQFEVIQHRLEHEYGAKCKWEPINIYKACWVELSDPKELEDFVGKSFVLLPWISISVRFFWPIVLMPYRWLRKIFRTPNSILFPIFNRSDSR